MVANDHGYFEFFSCFVYFSRNFSLHQTFYTHFEFPWQYFSLLVFRVVLEDGKKQEKKISIVSWKYKAYESEGLFKSIGCDRED